MSNIFRSRKYKHEHTINPLPIAIVSRIETDDNGTQIEVHEEVPINKVKLNLPDPKSYKLSDLLAAGIPLQEIAVSGMLNSSDLHDQSIVKEKLTDSMLEKLSTYEKNKSVSQSTEPSPAVNSDPSPSAE